MPNTEHLSARQPSGCRAYSTKEPKKSLFRLHPLFLLTGIWYACTGELFLFLLSALVAIQHECAHAFASASLGYRLHKIVLMPYGAVIDGDLTGISFKDEIFVAICGPLCNLITAVFFAALWWTIPTTYPFTDVACYSSLSIALINLLPAYPLDGGRILKCALTESFLKSCTEEGKAERRAEKICRALTHFFAGTFLALFILLCTKGVWNFSLLSFGIFLIVGAFGNRDKQAVYGKIDFSYRNPLEKGVEIRRVAVLESCTVKKALRFLTRGSYLQLEVYNEREEHLYDLSQNELSELFLHSESPYDTIEKLHKSTQKEKKAPLSLQRSRENPCETTPFML